MKEYETLIKNQINKLLNVAMIEIQYSGQAFIDYEHLNIAVSGEATSSSYYSRPTFSFVNIVSYKNGTLFNEACEQRKLHYKVDKNRKKVILTPAL